MMGHMIHTTAPCLLIIQCRNHFRKMGHHSNQQVLISFQRNVLAELTDQIVNTIHEKDKEDKIAIYL